MSQQDIIHGTSHHSHQPIRKVDDEDGNESLSRLSSGLGKHVAEVTNLLGHTVNNRLRSSSLGAFNFSAHILPLAQSLEDSHQANRAEAKIPTSSAIALVVGMQIGSGIFSSPGMLSQHAGSSGAALIVWMAAGGLAWTGASSFAELGSAIPVNGGAQAYLHHSFGPWASYLFVWTNLVALKPGSAAIISIVGAEYLCRIFYHTAFTASPSESARAIPLAVIKLVAILLLLLVSLVNGLSDRLGKQAPIILTMLKLFSLLTIVIMALVRVGQGHLSDSFQAQNLFAGTSHSPGDYVLALYSGLWAFDGWDTSNYIAGELKEARETLPVVIHVSMATVLLLFLATNISYLAVLPLKVVAQSNTIALDFGRGLLGAVGGLIFSLIVALSCFGALNSSVFTTARLISVAAEERYIPKLFSQIHATRNTPINALALQALVTIFMIIVGDFKSLVGFYGTCSWTFYLLTVGSLLLLRIREPDLERPYRTWLINPLIFTCVALFLLLIPIFSAPIQSIAAFGFIAIGLPVYYLTTQMQGGEAGGLCSYFQPVHCSIRYAMDTL
ncbi:hypothetical protein CROQUDRAFT_42031 [Cronartium quercuum f. sp. fusiforme G11]|uniref:Amino acid transporter n=1 Tax=Cronartium quercuum f. sp. fusiforme G11 TaxID=708437 RepID=A0A9P6NR51_9BASI|nr:hypothetical protein CROQUDRAFT_42031 [Cronartium quercuum f. sp. fusiforme G11]